jgi:hypothetical protein
MSKSFEKLSNLIKVRAPEIILPTLGGNVGTLK